MIYHVWDLKTLRTRKAIRKTPTRLFCEAGLFSCCKGNKIKISPKFRDPERLRFEDTKRILCHPKSFGTFKKRAFGDNLIPRVLSLPLRKERWGNRTDDYVVDRIVNWTFYYLSLLHIYRFLKIFKCYVMHDPTSWLALAIDRVKPLDFFLVWVLGFFSLLPSEEGGVKW